jgi:uncharacterized protein (DUF2141 family)
MRLSVLFLILLGFGASAQAQSNAPGSELHPVPEAMPGLLFAPEPLAGSMLEPFDEPQAPNVAGDDSETTPSVSPSVAQTPEAAPPPETASETPPASPSLAQTPESVPLPETDSETPAAAGEPDAVGTPTGDLQAPSRPETDVAIPGRTAPTDEVAPPDEAERASPAGEPEAPLEGSSTVHVIVENVESDAGVVNVAVCNTDLSREGCPYDTQVPASVGFVETQFDDIPPGRYAVVGYHDENGNEVFDKFLGMPREPYALSNTAGEKLVPTFEDAALTIKEGDNFIIVRLQRFGSE